jgi:hypothetical protein
MAMSLQIQKAEKVPIGEFTPSCEFSLVSSESYETRRPPDYEFSNRIKQKKRQSALLLLLWAQSRRLR